MYGRIKKFDSTNKVGTSPKKYATSGYVNKFVAKDNAQTFAKLVPILRFGLIFSTSLSPALSNGLSKMNMPKTEANESKNPMSNKSAGRIIRITIAARDMDETSSLFFENADENIYTPLIITARSDEAVNEQSIE